MHWNRFHPGFLFLIVALSCPGAEMAASPMVIAHRGASGYLPEHTLEAKALALGMGADALEQDVVLTRDGHFIVLHDIHLDTVTNVASIFPDRARADGRFYALDFTLKEIQSLSAGERFHRKTGEAVYSERFPAKVRPFRVPSLEEELQFIQGLEKSLGRTLAVYIEFKAPAWHREQGSPMEEKLLQLVHKYGYRQAEDPIFIQCFDPEGLRRMRNLGSQLRQVQLLGSNEWKEAPVNFDQLRAPEGLSLIREYAEGIGPWIPFCYTRESGEILSSGLVDQARENGLFVHPFTFRADAYPEDFQTFERLVTFFVEELKVDGLFTDHPDRVLSIIESKPIQE